MQWNEIKSAVFDETYEQLIFEFFVTIRVDHFTQCSDYIATSTLIKLGTTPGEYKHMSTTNH